MELVVAPVLHEYVPLPEAVSVAEGLVQVRVKVEGDMAAAGGVWFRVTEEPAVAVHPLDPVTVTE